MAQSRSSPSTAASQWKRREPKLPNYDETGNYQLLAPGWPGGDFNSRMQATAAARRLIDKGAEEAAVFLLDGSQRHCLDRYLEDVDDGYGGYDLWLNGVSSFSSRELDSAREHGLKAYGQGTELVEIYGFDGARGGAHGETLVEMHCAPPQPAIRAPDLATLSAPRQRPSALAEHSGVLA